MEKLNAYYPTRGSDKVDDADKAPYGQLTVKGANQMRVLGKQLKERYGDLIEQGKKTPGGIYCRATNFSRTVHSAQNLLVTLVPPETGSARAITIFTAKSDDEILYPQAGKACPRQHEIIHKITAKRDKKERKKLEKEKKKEAEHNKRHEKKAKKEKHKEEKRQKKLKKEAEKKAKAAALGGQKPPGDLAKKEKKKLKKQQKKLKKNQKKEKKKQEKEAKKQKKKQKKEKKHANKHKKDNKKHAKKHAKALKKKAKKEEKEKKHATICSVADSKALTAQLQTAFGSKEGSKLSLTQAAEVLTARQQNGLAPLKGFDAKAVARIDECNKQRWNDWYSDKDLNRLAIGRVVSEIQHQILGNISGENDTKLAIYTGHDTTLIPLLRGLKAGGVTWPDYGATLQIELWEKDRGDDKQRKEEKKLAKKSAKDQKKLDKKAKKEAKKGKGDSSKKVEKREKKKAKEEQKLKKKLAKKEKKKAEKEEKKKKEEAKKEKKKAKKAKKAASGVTKKKKDGKHDKKKAKKQKKKQSKEAKKIRNQEKKKAKKAEKKAKEHHKKDKKALKKAKKEEKKRRIALLGKEREAKISKELAAIVGKKEYYVRLIYNNKDVVLPKCGGAFCPLNKFQKLTSHLVSKHYDRECKTKGK